MSEKKVMPDAIQKLADAIEAKGLKVQFGLEQQGHIPYIEKKIAEDGWNYHTWKEIGKHIGWEPLTASCYYFDYLQHHSAMTEAPQDVNEAIKTKGTFEDGLKHFGYDGYSLAGNDKWISVDDRLPMCFHSGKWDGLKSDEVIVECENGSKHIAVLYSGILDGGQFNDWYDNSDFELHHVVKWTNIPL